MRLLLPLGAAIAFAALVFAASHGSAVAAGGTVKLTPDYGPKSDIFQFAYTVRPAAADPACTKIDLALTWDDAPLGSVPLVCASLSASGAVTPPASANAIGRHIFCIGNEALGSSTRAPKLCVPYTITPGPGECDPTGRSSPECVVATTTPFEPDCIPTGRPTSPLCVTRTPIPIDCSNPSSPPCAESPTPPEPPPPTETPATDCTDPALATAPECATSTPTRAPSTTPTPPGPACDGPTPPAGAPCATRTPVETCTAGGTPETAPRACASPESENNSDSGGGGVSIRWTAVAIVAGAVAATGGITAGGWWWWNRA